MKQSTRPFFFFGGGEGGGGFFFVCGKFEADFNSSLKSGKKVLAIFREACFSYCIIFHD